MTCSFCGWSKAKSAVGLKRHENRCKSNPTKKIVNINGGNPVEQRVRLRAGERLAEAEQLVRAACTIFDDDEGDDAVGRAKLEASLAAFASYHELVGLLEAV